MGIFDFLWRYGPWPLMLLLIIYVVRVVADEDRSALLRAKIYKALYVVTGKTEAEKKYISNDIKGKLNLARRNMHFGKQLLPRAAEVEWVAGEKGSTVDIKEGEFIVRLDPSEEQTKNIVLLATAIVRRTSLIGLRRCLERPLESAFEVNLVRNLLGAVNAHVLDWYLKHEYDSIASKDEETRSWSEKLALIDERGLLTRLLLVELEDFARIIHGKPTRLYMTGEIEELIRFIYGISERRFGQLTPLECCLGLIRIGVILIAKPSKLLHKGTAPYVTAMNRNLSREVSSVYVLQYDKDYLLDADPEFYRQISEQLKALDTDLVQQTVAQKDFELKYRCLDVEGNPREAKITRYRRPTVD